MSLTLVPREATSALAELKHCIHAYMQVNSQIHKVRTNKSLKMKEYLTKM